MFLSQYDAEAIISPYNNLFIECMHLSWRKYWSPLFDTVRHTFTARTRANMVHDFMVADAQDRFAGIESVKFHTFGGVFFMTIDGKVLIRFKKLNDNKMPSNIPTQQAQDWMEQKGDIIKSCG
jgi:hypothetical protein